MSAIDLIVHKKDPGVLDELLEAVEALRLAGHSITPHVTFERGDTERFAAEGTLRGADLIIAAGGDGTLNAAANGILGALPGAAADKLPRLGIVKLGTANDFASYLEIPPDIADAMA